MAIVGSAPKFIASKSREEIEALDESENGAIYFSNNSGHIYLGNGGKAAKYGGETGDFFTGADLNGLSISGIKTWIKSSDVLNIPINFEYNCSKLRIDGVVNCDGTINTI